MMLAHGHLGLLDYAEYLRLGEAWRLARLEGRFPDTVVTATHLPVVTLGRDTPSGEDDLRLPAADLARAGVPVYRVERGGRATYHGPGQLMVYPVIDIRRRGLGPVDFANLLLEAAEKTARAVGCPGSRRLPSAPGLWVGDAKLASVGLSVREWVTTHGLALNLSPEPGLGFGAVHPCGAAGTPVTDLETATGRRPDRVVIARAVAEALAGLLGEDPAPLAAEELLGAKPPWLVGRASGDAVRASGGSGIYTVCEAADCPNHFRCAAEGRVTYLLLGPSCTRACRFCRVSRGRRPHSPDPGEPERVGRAVAAGLSGARSRSAAGPRHVVLTSVTRDDLDDGGAAHFAAAVRAVRRHAPSVTVEVLVPDFRGKRGALEAVLASGPDVVGHNLETVPRLYPRVRPGADYAGSLELIARVASGGVPVRSGLLLGMGEDGGEVLGVIRDLAGARCRLLWLGQYLRPTPAHYPVARYAPPAEFDRLAAQAGRLGFTGIAAGPLVRSSCSSRPPGPTCSS